MTLSALICRVALVLLGLCIPMTGAVGQQCDDCSRPRIALYDADVQVPRPTSGDSLVAWWSLQYVMGVARSHLISSDPTRDCVTWLDGAMVNARDFQGDTLRFGLDNPNLPPAGEISAADYVIAGTITQSSGNSFLLALRLETAVSRELVVERTATFVDNAASKGIAGQSAAAQLMPMLQTIRGYEVNKRNSDVTVAIRDLWTKSTGPDITVTPRKNPLNPGDSTQVDIEMIDCDGVPLSNREIRFDEETIDGNLLPGTTGGTIDPSSVVTDGNGKASVKFTAASTKEPAIISAWYVHKKPCGRGGVFYGHASVNIVPRTFIVRVQSAYDYDESFEWNISLYKEYVHRNTRATTNILFVYASYDSTSNPDSVLWISYPPKTGDSVDILSVTGFKQYSKIEDSKSFESGGGLSNALHSDIYEKGTTYLDSTSIMLELTFSATAKHLYFSPMYRWEGSGRDATFDKQTGWQRDSWTYRDSGSTWSCDCPGMDFVKAGGDYVISYEGTTITTDTLIGKTITTTFKGFEMVVAALDNPTGVAGRSVELPSSFLLKDAYPNPCNPTATVEYTIPVYSRVNLKMYDVLGQLVATIVDAQQPPGSHSAVWDASGLSSGVYFYRLEAVSIVGPARAFSDVKKILLLK